MSISKMRSIVLALILLSVSSFSFAGVVTAHETTPEHAEEHQIEALLEQIQALLAVIEALQAQIVAMQSGVSPVAVGFSQNYGIGDENIEIRTLQEILNQDPRTQVAASGPGSPGQESTYYGVLTADAVSRFQEVYASEILLPAGLSRGTGYFGSGTRAKMNALVQAKSGAITVLTPKSDLEHSISEQTDASEAADAPANTFGDFSTDQSLDLSLLSGNESTTVDSAVTSGGGAQVDALSTSLVYETSDTFAVGEASSYAGAPGENITIKGIKLTNGTKINFDDTAITGIASSDGTSLTFAIPDIEKGPYELTFTSESGEEAIRIMDFVVTFQNATAPEIFSISPSLGADGTLITIRGTGFTATGNQIEFGQNVVAGVPSSDGKTLKVNVASGLEIPTSAEFSETGVAEWPVFIYIANANGRVEEPGLFVIRN